MQSELIDFHNVDILHFNNPINLMRVSCRPSLDVTKCTSCLTSLSSDLQAKFEFHHGDYEKQCLHALGRKDKAGMVMNNPTQSVFLFMDRQHLQVSQLCCYCFDQLKHQTAS